MFRDTMEGLDMVFHTDVKPPKVILVTGPPGSMKTTFVHTIFSKYLKKTGQFGMYVTLEETTESLLESIESLGIELVMNLRVSDFTEVRGKEKSDQLDYLKLIGRLIETYKEAYGDKFTVFGLDSLGALYSLSRETADMRVRMYNFFQMLRQHRLCAFIIMERGLEGRPAELLGNEGFLSDGILMLGLKNDRGKLVRFLQVEKMRACNHSMEAHVIEPLKGGISVVGPIFT